MEQRAAISFLAALLVCASSLPARGAGEDSQIRWSYDYASALREARATNRPLLVHVTATWCPACMRLERTTFVDPKVVELVNQLFVPLHVDADRSPQLAKQLAVERLPVAMVFAPDGAGLGRLEGYRPADLYANELTRLLERLPAAKRPEAPTPELVAASSSPEPAAEPHRRVRLLAHLVGGSHPEVPKKQTPHLEPANDVRYVDHGSGAEHGLVEPGEMIRSASLDTPLALDGYCVVSLLEKKRLVRGLPEFRMAFDGQYYQFSGASELEKFRVDPSRYAPALGGRCPVSFVDEGREVAGSPNLGARYRGRLYLFADADARRRFQQDPRRYVDCDLALAGRCPVCWSEKQAAVDGTPDIRELSGSRLYRFESTQHRQAFLDDTPRFVPRTSRQP